MSEQLRTQELLAQEGLESIAQKLYNNINIELAGKPDSARRWVWELLQNAKDVIAENGQVEIILNDTEVTLAHNGIPFRHSSLLALLSQRSTKSPSYTDDEKQEFFDKLFNEEVLESAEIQKFLSISGRFGTGFMTTYLLSKNICLESIYEMNDTTRAFSLSLDRDAPTPDLMKQKVIASFKAFADMERSGDSASILEGYQEGSQCHTRFIYKYTPESKATAEKGIEDLHKSITYTLSFIKNLNSIRVLEYGRKTVYTKMEPVTQGDIMITRIQKETDEETTIIHTAIVSEREGVLAIAVSLSCSGDKTYRLDFPDPGTPRTFTSFPLVGSESFPFPVIIHSPLFNPNDLRSHVFLNLSGDKAFDKKVALNRALFERSMKLFSRLLTHACQQGWRDVFYLAKSDLPLDIDADWYRTNIQQSIRREIMDAAIVITEDPAKAPIKPRDAKFPVYHKEKLDDFWEICKLIAGDTIPRKADAGVWRDIVQAESRDWLNMDIELDLEKLLMQIQDTGSFTDFRTHYFAGDDKAAFGALNKIISFTESENKELLDRKVNPLQVFPDQTVTSIFREKRSLHRDAGIPYQLKDALKETGENWYEKLVRNELQCFERDSRLSVKDVSNKLRDQIEKLNSGKLSAAEVQALDTGLFTLLGYSLNETDQVFKEIHRFSKRLFPDKTPAECTYLPGAEELEISPVHLRIVKLLLTKVAGFQNLNILSMFLYNLPYPEEQKNLTEEETDLKFKTDSFINDFIAFILSFHQNQYHLLSSYAVIPNQLNTLCKLDTDLFSDSGIPEELKEIYRSFGTDCRKNLLHYGVSVALTNTRDLKWICDQLDDVAILHQQDEAFKQPIRELDKWISKHKGTVPYLDELFKSFYRKRSGIVLNTYDLKERDQFDEILKSGMSADFADIVKSGTKPETIKELVAISKEVNLDSALILLKKHPELTSEKIEQLLELEELSKGWNTEITYRPDEEQKRRNFENGWKGEAFVYKQMTRWGFEVEWMNCSSEPNHNAIIDFEGETHFIADTGQKYDLRAATKDGKILFIQVKATVTDIVNADQFALPISTREWKFVLETQENESYYLARVFNVNSALPELYFMNLRRPEDL